MQIRLIKAFLMAVSVVCPLAANAVLAEDFGLQPHLLLSYFTGNGEDGLHLAHSRDGYLWKALKNGRSLLKPAAGRDRLMRDPSVVQGSDGTFHMVTRRTRRSRHKRTSAWRLAIAPKDPLAFPANRSPGMTGPSAVKIDGRWFVSFDKYRKHRYGLVVSRDLASWTDQSEKLRMPKGIRHGTVFRVPEEVARGLLDLD